MLKIHVPNTYISERNYIIKTIMCDFLGIDINLLIEARNDVLIETSDNESGRSLRIIDVLFQTPINQWLTADSLPKQPLQVWDITGILTDVLLVSSKIPVIYGSRAEVCNGNNRYLSENQHEIYLGLDIFGSAFFMLTRYDEYVMQGHHDQHGRILAASSLAYQEGFLDRPIINEYVEILWWLIKLLWPRIERKKRKFRILVSHDVDVPFALVNAGLIQMLYSCGGDILNRKSVKLALNRCFSYIKVQKGDYKSDINYSFDRLMDISERYNLRSAFYFKTGCTNSIFDVQYSLDHPAIRQLIRDINIRGHEVGLHPSYETYRNPVKIAEEFHNLLRVCNEEGIWQNEWGGRQHYLRWQVPVTWRNWEEAGLNYDSTLSYADYVGFRCGVCVDFPVYDIEKKICMNLRERPLVVMEGTIFDYMGLSGEAAIVEILKLKERCRTVNGDFTLLWHNSYFYDKRFWKLYENILQ